jgi:hypothetical protein
VEEAGVPPVVRARELVPEQARSFAQFAPVAERRRAQACSTGGANPGAALEKEVQRRVVPMRSPPEPELGERTRRKQMLPPHSRRLRNSCWLVPVSPQRAWQKRKRLHPVTQRQA